jgi:hypothetical protein
MVRSGARGGKVLLEHARAINGTANKKQPIMADSVSERSAAARAAVRMLCSKYDDHLHRVLTKSRERKIALTQLFRATIARIQARFNADAGKSFAIEFIDFNQSIKHVTTYEISSSAVFVRCVTSITKLLEPVRKYASTFVAVMRVLRDACERARAIERADKESSDEIFVRKGLHASHLSALLVSAIDTIDTLVAAKKHEDTSAIDDMLQHARLHTLHVDSAKEYIASLLRIESLFISQPELYKAVKYVLINASLFNDVTLAALLSSHI